MTVEYRVGDLFASDLPALAHGCNCAGVMGSGIAMGFRRRWPVMYREYRNACLAEKFRLGGVHIWQVFEPGGVRRRVIFNLMTQRTPGAQAELPAIKMAVTAMTDWAEQHDLPAIGMPRIGAGLGRLPWEPVAAVIEKVAGPSPVEIVIFELPSEKKEGKEQ